MGAGHLIEKGRRNILLLSAFPVAGRKTSGAELDTLREVFKRKGLSSKGSMVKVCGQQPLDGYAAVSRMLRKGEKFDAIQINHDLLATGVVLAILEARLEIPEDIAIVSHANKGAEILSHIPLTTVEVNTEAIAANVVEIALGMKGSAMDVRTSSPAKVLLRQGLST